MNAHTPILIGIFIGGRSTRMGGIPKGTLREPHGPRTLVERLLQVTRSAVAGSEPVLVGEAAGYEHLELERLRDEPPGIGPLGGLIALLNAGQNRNCAQVLALACDLPFVNEAVLERLVAHAPEAAAVAPHCEGRWQPLCARYSPIRALPAARAAVNAREHALKRVLDRLGADAEPLPLSASEQALLADWDDPNDVRASTVERSR